MKRSLWVNIGWIAGTFAVLFLVASIFGDGFVVEDYGFVCTRCLQHGDWVDKSLFGIRYSHVQRPDYNPLWLGIGEGSATVDPQTYERIFGRPCQHHYVRYGGFGRQSNELLSISMGDGLISSPPALRVRLSLIARVFETFTRVPERTLAQETYNMIDEAYPENLGWYFMTPMSAVLDADAVPNEPMSILYRGLAVVHSAQDWQTILDAAKAHNGNIPLLTQNSSKASSP